MQDPVSEYNSIFGGVQQDAPSGLNPVQSYEEAFGSEPVQTYINLDYRPRYDKYASIDVDLDYWRAKNQSIGGKIVNAIPRLVGQTIGKTIEDVGLLVGLTGIGNNYDERGGWIAGAADNWLAQYGASLDEASKELFPIFKMPGYDETNTFQKMSTASFWTDEVTDGLAFMASALIPGTAVAKAGKVAKLSKLFGSAETLEALFAGSKAGMSAAKINKAQNLATVWAFQTAGEAMFEAKDSRDQTIANLTGKINPDTGMAYTQDEIVSISAQNAADTFQGNLMALAVSNALEVKWLFGGSKAAKGLFGMRETGELGSEIAAKELKGFQRFLDGYTGRILKGVGKGAAAEGLWEENIQYSIQQLNDASLGVHREDNSAEKFLKGIPGLLDLGDDKRLQSVMLGAVLGVGGGIVSEARQKRRDVKDFVAGKKYIDDMDKRISSFDVFEKNPDVDVELTVNTTDNTFYVKKGGQETQIEKEEFDKLKEEHQGTKWKEDGGFKLENGKKKVNPAKLNAFVSQVDYFGKLMTALEYEKSKKIQDKNKIDLLRNDILTEWIVSHLKIGAYDELVKRIDILGKADADSLAIWAADPDVNPKEEVSKIKRKAESLKNIYDYVQDNIYDEDGSYTDLVKRKDKFYVKRDKVESEITEQQYESLRQAYGGKTRVKNPGLRDELIKIASRVDMLKTQRGNMESRKAGLGSTPEEFNYQIEAVNKEIDHFNALSKQLDIKSMTRGANINDLQEQVIESEKKIKELKREYAESSGINVNEDLSKITDLKGPFAKMSDQINALIADYDVSINELNKEWDLYAGKDGDIHFKNRVQGVSETGVKITDKTTPTQFAKGLDNAAKIRGTEFSIDAIEDQYYDKAVNDQLDAEGLLETVRRVLRESKPISQLTRDRLSKAMLDALNEELSGKFELEYLDGRSGRAESMDEYVYMLRRDGQPEEDVQEWIDAQQPTEKDFQEDLNLFISKELFKGSDTNPGYIQRIQEVPELKGVPSSDQIKRMIIEEKLENSNSIAEAFVASPEEYTSYQNVEKDLNFLKRLAELNTLDVVGDTTMTRVKEIKEVLDIEFKTEGLIAELEKRIHMLDFIYKIAKDNADNRSKMNKQYGDAFIKRMLDAFGANQADDKAWSLLAPILDGFEGGFGIAQYQALIFNLKQSDIKDKVIKALEDKLESYRAEAKNTFLDKNGNSIIIDAENGRSVSYDRFTKNPKTYFLSIITNYYMATDSSLKQKGSPLKDYLIHDDIDKLREDLVKLSETRKELAESLIRAVDLYTKVSSVRDVLYELDTTYNPASVIGKFSDYIDDNIPVTTQQEIALNKMLHFLNNVNPNPYSNIAFIKGLAGTGKTNVFFRTLLKITGTPIQTAAPNPTSSLVLSRAAGKETPTTTDDLLEGKVELIKSGLLVIDEVNTYDPGKLAELLKKLAQHSAENPGFKVLLMGDPLQFSAVGSKGESYFYLDQLPPGFVNDDVQRARAELMNGIERLPSLSIVYRSYVGPLNEFIDKFKGETNIVSTVTAKCNTDVLGPLTEHPLGVYGVQDFESWMAATIHTIEESSKLDEMPRKRLIISNFGRTKEISNALAEAKITNVEVMPYAVAMGQTVNEAYVFIEKEQTVTPEDYNSILYTMFSRPTDFLLVGGINVSQAAPDINMSTDALSESRNNDVNERRTELKESLRQQLSLLDKVEPEAKETNPVNEPVSKVEEDDLTDIADITPVRSDVVTEGSFETLVVGHPTSKAMNKRYIGKEVRIVRTINDEGEMVSVMVNTKDDHWKRVGVLSDEQAKLYDNKQADKLRMPGEDHIGNLDDFTLDTGTYSQDSAGLGFKHGGEPTDVNGKESLIRKYLAKLGGGVLMGPDDMKRMLSLSKFVVMTKTMKNVSKLEDKAVSLNIGHTYLQIGGIRYKESAKDSKNLYYWMVPTRISDPAFFQPVNDLVDALKDFDALTGLSYNKRDEDYMSFIRHLSDAPSVSTFKEPKEGKYDVLAVIQKKTGKTYTDEELEQIKALAQTIDALVWKKEEVEWKGEKTLRRQQTGHASKVIETLTLSNPNTSELIIRRPINKNSEAEGWSDENTKWEPLSLMGTSTALLNDFLADPLEALKEPRHKRFKKLLEYQYGIESDLNVSFPIAVDQYTKMLGNWTIESLEALSSFDENGYSNQNNGFGLRRDIDNSILHELNAGNFTDGNGNPYIQEDLQEIRETQLVIEMNKKEPKEAPVEPEVVAPVKSTPKKKKYKPNIKIEDGNESNLDPAPGESLSANLEYFIDGNEEALSGLPYYKYAKAVVTDLLNTLIDGVELNESKGKYERIEEEDDIDSYPMTMQEAINAIPEYLKEYLSDISDENGELLHPEDIVQYRAYRALLSMSKQGGKRYVLNSVLQSIIPLSKVNEFGDLTTDNPDHIHDIENNQKDFQKSLFANTKLRLSRIKYISGVNKGTFMSPKYVTAVLLKHFKGTSSINTARAGLSGIPTAEAKSILAFLNYLANEVETVGPVNKKGKETTILKAKQLINKENKIYFKKEDFDLREALSDNNVFMNNGVKTRRLSTESTRDFIDRCAVASGLTSYEVQNLYVDAVLWNTKNELETQMSLKKGNPYALERIEEKYKDADDNLRTRWVWAYRKRHGRGGSTTITDHFLELVRESFDVKGIFNDIKGSTDPDIVEKFLTALSSRKEASVETLKDAVIKVYEKYNSYWKSDEKDRNEENRNKAIESVASSIRHIADAISSYDNRFQSDSYIAYRADGKTRYLWSQTSYGYKRLNELKTSQTFKFNKVIEVSEYDAMNDQKRRSKREFNDEEFDQVIFRQFFGQVLGVEKGFADYYFQDAMTISSTKRLFSAKMSLLDQTAVNSAIKELVDYEKNRPDLDVDVYSKNKNKSYLPGISHYENGKAFDYDGNEIKDVVKAVLAANKVKFEEGFAKWEEDSRFVSKDGKTSQPFEPDARFAEKYPKYAERYKLDSSAQGLDAIKALMEVWHMNVMVNSYLLDQHTVGDYAFFGDPMKVAKRAKIVYTEGYSRETDDKSRIVIVNDIDRLLDRNTFSKLEYAYEFMEGKKFTANDSFAFALPEQMEKEAERLGYGTGIHMVLKPIIAGYRDVKAKDGETIHSVPFGVKCAVFTLTDEFIKDNQFLTDLADKMRASKVGFIAPHSAIKYGAPNVRVAATDTVGKEMYGDFTEDSIFEFKADSFRMIFNPEDEVDSTNKINAQFIQSINELNTPETRRIAAKVHEILGNIYHRSRQQVRQKVSSQGRLRRTIYDEVKNSSGKEGIEEFLGFALPQNQEHFYKDIENGEEAREIVEKILGKSLSKQWLKMPSAKFIDNFSDKNKDEVELIMGLEKSLLEYMNQEKIDDLKKDIFHSSGFDVNFPLTVDNNISTINRIFAKGTTEFKIPGSKLVLFPSVGMNNPETGKPLMAKDKDGFVEILVPKGSVYKVGDVMFSYRMPTSGLHMGIPCRVVGFTNTYDNKVVIPAEYVLIHGIDFDVDELYVMRLTNLEAKYPDLYAEFEAQDKFKKFTKYLQAHTDKNLVHDALMDAYKNDLVNLFIEVLKLKEIQKDMNLSFLTERFKRAKGAVGGDSTMVEDMGADKESMELTDAFGRAMITVTANSAKTTVGKAVRTKSGGDYLGGTKEEEPKVLLSVAQNPVEITIVDVDKDGVRKPVVYNTLTRQEKDVNGAVSFTFPANNENQKETTLLAKTPQTNDAYVQTVIDNENDGIATALGISTANVHMFIAASNLGISLKYIAKIFKTRAAQTILRAKFIEQGFTKAESNHGRLAPTIDINNIEPGNVVGFMKMLDKVGNDIKIAGEIGSLIRVMPSDYMEIEKMIKNVSHMYSGEVMYGNTPNLKLKESFTIQTDILKEYEGIRQALENMLMLKSQYEETIFRYNPELNKFADRIRLDINSYLGGSEVGQNIKEKTEEVMEEIRKAILSYYSSTISFYFKGKKVSLDVSKEEPILVKDKEFTGIDAFNERFANEVRKNQLKYPGNRFLNQVSVNRDWGYATVKCATAHNMDYTTILGMKKDFAALSNDFQAQILKYAVLNNSMKIGGTNLTIGMPEDIWMDYNRSFRNTMEKIAKTESLEGMLAIKDDIILKMIFNYAEDISSFKDYGDFEKEGRSYTRGVEMVNGNKVFFDKKLKFKEVTNGLVTTIFSPQKIIVQFGELYYLVHKDKDTRMGYYQKIAKASRSEAVVGNIDVINNGYDIDKVIKADTRTFVVKSFSDKQEYNKLYDGDIEVGDKIFQRLYSDVSRVNMTQYYVVGIIDNILQLDHATKVDHSGTYKAEKERDPFREQEFNKDINSIMDAVRERFNLKVETINDPAQFFKGKIKGDTMVINLAHAEPSTVWHEVFHPLIELVQKENKDLYDKFEKEVKKEKNMLAAVAADPYYAQLSPKQQMKEAMVMIMEQHSKSSSKSSLSKLVREMLAAIAEIIGKVLNISGISDKTTLKDLTNAIVVGDVNIDLSTALDPQMDNMSTNEQTFFSRPLNSQIEAVMDQQASIEVVSEDGKRSYKKNGQTYASLTERVGSWFTGWASIEKRIEESAEKEFGKVGADIESGNVVVEEVVYNFLQYKAKLAEEFTKHTTRGHILHKAMEMIVASSKKFDQVQEEFYTQVGQQKGGEPRHYNWIFRKAKRIIDAIGLDAEHMEWNGNDLERVMPTSFKGEQDTVYTEVKYTDDLFGVGTAADLIVKRSNGALGFFDYKFGLSFNKEWTTRLLKHSDDMVNQYFESPKNIAMLELMWRVFVYKKNNPEARFSDIALIWTPMEGAIQRTDVPTDDMLTIIENFVKAEYADNYQEMKNNGLFEFTNYLTRDMRVNNILKGGSIDDAIAKYQADLESFIRPYEWRKAKGTLSQKYKEYYELQIKIAKEKLDDLITLPGTDYASAKEISWFRYHLASLGEQSNAYIQDFHLFLTGRKRKEDDLVNNMQNRFDKLLDDLFIEKGYTKAKRAVSRWAGVNVYDFWSFMYQEVADGSVILRHWSTLNNPAERAIAKEMQESMKLYDEIMNQDLWTIGNEKKKQWEVTPGGEKYKTLPPGFMPKHPITEMELAQQYKGGLLNPKYLKASLMNYVTDFHDSYNEHYLDQKTGEAKNGMPGTVMPMRFMGNSLVATTRNHTMNAAIWYPEFMKMLYHKQQMEGVVAYGMAMKLQMQAKNLGYSAGFLDKQIKHLVLGKKYEFQLTRQPIMVTGKDGKKYAVDQRKVLLSLKHFITISTMWWSPVKGSFNWVMIGLNTAKIAVSGSVSKLFGVPREQILFSTSDLTAAHKEYTEYSKAWMLGDQDNNKLNNIAKVMHYLSDNYDMPIRPTSASVGSSKFFDNSLPFIFQRVGEDYGNLIVLAAILKHNKLPDGKSFWDAFDNQGNWIDTQEREIKVSETVTNKVVGLTDLEYINFKRISQRINGSYRKDEAPTMEMFVLGEFAMQFKKYMPAILLNMWGGKFNDMSLGYYTKVDDVYTGNSSYEWVTRENQGVVRTFIHLAMVSRLFMNKKATAEAFEKLSTLQKLQLSELAVTALMVMGWTLAKMGIDDDDKEKNLYIRTNRLLGEDISQGLMPMDVLRNLKSQTIVFPKMVLIFDAFGKFMWDGVIQGERQRDGRIPGQLKLEQTFMPLIPIFGMQPEINKFLNESSTKDEIGFLSLYDDMQKVR